MDTELTRRQRRTVRESTRVSNADLADKFDVPEAIISTYRSHLPPDQQYHKRNLLTNPITIFTSLAAVVGITAAIVLPVINDSGTSLEQKVNGNEITTIETDKSNDFDLRGLGPREFIQKYGLSRYNNIYGADDELPVSLRELSQEHLAGIMQSNDPTIDQVVPEQFTSGRYAVPFSADQTKIVEEYTQTIESALKDFFAFYDGQIYPRSTKIVIPTNSSDIRYRSEGGSLLVHLVDETGEFEESHYSLRFNGRNIGDSYKISTDEQGAEIGNTLGFEYDDQDQRWEYGYVSIEPIITSPNENSIYIVEGGPAEVLHEIISQETTFGYILSEVQDTFGTNKKLDRDKLENIVNEWLTREEHLVHALITNWIIDYNEREKLIPQEDINSRLFDFTLVDKYRQVPNIVANYPGKEGSAEMLKLYQTSPDILFEPYGL